MTPEDVARFLRDNPGFFQDHPDVLAQLHLPDPHQGNAISLVERQTSLLRERVKALELRLSELMRIGRDNDRLARDLVDWTKALLAEPDRARSAQITVAELQRIFGVPLVQLRTWGWRPHADEARIAYHVAGLGGPVCGSEIDLAPIGPLPADWGPARSYALIPLRHGDAPALGLILLGSPDPARFDASLGTAVLARIGELAGAALAAAETPPGESASPAAD